MSLIDDLTDRFLSWRLPEDFSPDAGISFEPNFNQDTQWPMKHEPTGTNLFDAYQAKEMIEHILDGIELQSREWVPVSERLPENDVPVLVVSKLYPDKISAAMITGDSDGWAWAVSKGYFNTLNDPEDYEFDDDYEFSHWMPLPEPPNE